MQAYIEKRVSALATERGYVPLVSYAYSNQATFFFMRDGQCAFTVFAAFQPAYVKLTTDAGAVILRKDGQRPMTCWYAKNEDMAEFYAYFEEQLPPADAAAP